MALHHSFLIIANNVSGAEKRFFNAFRASEQSTLIVNERQYELYTTNGHLKKEDPCNQRILILKEGRLLRSLYRQLYLRRRAKGLYILLQRIVILWSLFRNRPQLRCFTHIHAVLDGVRYLPFLRKIHPSIQAFASVVDPTLEFNRHKARLFGLQNCNHIDSLNVNIRAELMRLGFADSRLSVTPGSFTDYDRIQPLPKKPLVTFCARLIKPKNPLVFVAIADAFVKRYPATPVQFMLLGDGPLKATIDQQLAANPALQQILTAPGYVPNPAATFAESLVFVQLSDTEIHGTQSMLEAMGAGCYIMVSYLAGIEQVVKDSFGKILPLNADDFADHLKERLDHFAATVQQGAMAREHALKHFHVSNFLAYLFAMYQQAAPFTGRYSLFRIIPYALLY